MIFGNICKIKKVYNNMHYLKHLVWKTEGHNKMLELSLSMVSTFFLSLCIHPGQRVALERAHALIGLVFDHCVLKFVCYFF